MEMNSYCSFVQSKDCDPVHSDYHDHEYGFPLYSDDELFGRLLLEINQAGLSWQIILKRKQAFYHAYSGFRIDLVAAYDEQDFMRLLQDKGIIRNKLKIRAAIYNARKIMELQKEYGSFSAWLDAHHPLSKQEWTRLFRKNFTFTGGEIVNEFLMSTGYLPGAHSPNCPIYPAVLHAQPRWLQTVKE
jgi:DNA-3-methyladenine glycosylase I